MSLLPYGLRRHVVRGLMHGVWGRLSHAKVYGLKDLPDGPCLFICNHLSNADGFTLYRALRPRRVVFLAGVKLHGTVMTRLAAETMDTIDITPNSPDIEALRRCV
ncbi:MAG: 1-acyl-sn-glycerol-3-phosphate acyltransferase, partial [Myxococcaceae bacterium]